MKATLTKVGSFMKLREVKGQEINSRRYRYAVTGSEEVIDQLIEDINDPESPFRSCEITDEGTIYYYAWDFIPSGIMLKRADNKNAWFPDMDELDEMNSLAGRFPHLVEKISLKGLLETLVKDKEPTPVAEKEETEEIKEPKQTKPKSRKLDK